MIEQRDYQGYIYDDEFPAENWLLNLLKACKQYHADGAVGPVNCHFDEEPPKWIVRGKFWHRPTYPTGLIIDGEKGRTGNVLLKRELFADNREPFQPEFHAGEDQEFFSEMIEKGHSFVWCNEAVAYEVVPPERWKRSFILRRSLFQGSFAPLDRTFSMVRLIKSAIAIPAYLAIMPFVAIMGHHRFMALSVKLAYHIGMVLSYLGIRIIREPYVTN